MHLKYLEANLLGFRKFNSIESVVIGMLVKTCCVVDHRTGKSPYPSSHKCRPQHC